MPVPKEYVGVPFRQRAVELRWRKDDRTPMSSVRDPKGENIIRFDADDNVNIEALMHSRAIVRIEGPTRRTAKAEPVADAPSSEEPAQSSG